MTPRAERYSRWSDSYLRRAMATADLVERGRLLALAVSLREARDRRARTAAAKLAATSPT